ncbi:MAG TPA: hypothetical protein VMV27_12535 [Candidatus Binataceae bacterium]|nr:hypothetical protein [Candidatus Binataceae bacterium]
MRLAIAGQTQRRLGFLVAQALACGVQHRLKPVPPKKLAIGLMASLALLFISVPANAFDFEDVCPVQAPPNWTASAWRTLILVVIRVIRAGSAKAPEWHVLAARAQKLAMELSQSHVTVAFRVEYLADPKS